MHLQLTDRVENSVDLDHPILTYASRLSMVKVKVFLQLFSASLFF